MNPPVQRLTVALGDRYRLERELGAGGMATVYLAHDVRHDRKVAIKVLKPELAAVLGAERFVQEIKTTAALSHPHILPLFDSGTADGFLFYVMPYIKGETIREKLNRETQFGVDEAIRIAREVADALDHAHRHGVIHRDIKPENLLLYDGRAMVMDFGIALAVSAAAGGRMTETGLSLGTPHYMSPEQATADKDLSGRSDVYSLASVLYEMLTGQPPHVGASAQQIIMKIIAEPAQPVTALRKAVAPNVAAAISRALEKLPADRFESARAFADALVNPSYATASMTALSPSAPGARAVSMPVFAATAAVAVLALAAAVWNWRTSAPPAQVTRLSLALPDSQELSPNSQTTRIAISRDGRQVVTASVGIGEGRRLIVRSLEHLRGVPLQGTESAMNPSFSPDGRRVAFVTSASPRTLRVAPIAGGPVTTLTDSLVDLGGVSWGRDGYIYFDAHFEGDGLARIPEGGGTPEIATVPDSTTGEQYHVNPSALPEGRGILFSIARAGGAASWDIGVLDAKTRKHSVLLRGVQAVYSPSGHLLYVTNEGLLMAAPFDLGKLRITGEPTAMAEGVAIRGNARVDLSISDDGALLYTSGRVSASAVEFVWVTRNGVVTQVDPGFAREFGNRPSLSPDGKALTASIVDGAVRSIWVKQLDRGPASKVAPSGVRPRFTPDGNSIVFASFANVMRVPSDGSTVPTELFTATNTGGPLEITRDGKWLLYVVSGARIVGRRLDGDTATRVFVADRSVVQWPAVSPDGRWLAYSSDETGRFEVYVRPFDRPETAKRQISTNEGYGVRWSPDGRELYYVDSNADMIAVPVLPGVAFTFGAPARLFSTNPFALTQTLFEVAPDGRRFLMSRPIGAEAQRVDDVILVQNFFQELKAKVKQK